ncbi:hypothetical protein [Pseudomonas sp. PSKL.D1]|uniref:hypothetical protein n=1 Tax=Pseudomonas sp. PSKL.D1 TaxID=3029060 RepID=UPI00238100C6|nr:hypothetical protein [Pseudomonas sp. PSKL.D1]WDY56769.1 hypothetical protein PVV54_19610 [Pseudomonas sp. PSKL.D1]
MRIAAFAGRGMARQAEWRLNEFDLIGESRCVTDLLASFSHKIDVALFKVSPTFPLVFFANANT